MSKTRIEKDLLGEVEVEVSKKWKSQTQRSLENFPIGVEKMPFVLIKNLALLKMACAIANENVGKISKEQKEIIVNVCLQIMNGEWNDQFPLSIWQTGSGTQTNMNMNEVITVLGNDLAGKDLLHPNDVVNASQSSNDVFPCALHMMCADLLTHQLFPVLDRLSDQLSVLQEENQDILKIGRTHFQDATPLRFSQEISGWKSMIDHSIAHLQAAMPFVQELAIGASAVGTGINVPDGFQSQVVAILRNQSGINYKSDPNLFHALSSRDAMSFLSGALKTLAANAMKMANDIRFLSSGPRAGIGEIKIPENEPGSSIMPGKVNPTQCEALSMVCLQVMGNDAAVTFAASQGHFQLNVFMPLIAWDLYQSITLLSDSLASFTERVLKGLKADEKRMRHNLENSLMLVTALSPIIGYEKAGQIARTAYLENLSLKQANEKLGFLDPETMEELLDLKNFM